MRQELKAQVNLPGVTLEVRSYEWDRPESWVMNTPSYRVSRQLRRTRARQDIRWRLPNERGTREVDRFSVLPAHSPITVETGPGALTAVHCVFPSDRFEQLIEIEQWTNELTAAFLGMRNPLIETLLDRLAREIMFPRARAENVLDAIITLLTAELGHIARHGESGGRRSGKLESWQLDRLRKEVNETLHGGSVNVADLAASCSISPRHLVRRFKASTGDTIHGYVRRLRLDRAKALLATEGVMLKDIAAELGFKTPSHFAAEFRQQAGCSPSEYRARLRMK
jgi:AraC family transcriptional regulator